MKMPRPWDRKLWGIEFRPMMAGDSPMILGSAWDEHRRPNSYKGEPTRTLVFNTRTEARQWIQGRKGTSGAKNYRVIRVRELTEKIA